MEKMKAKAEALCCIKDSLITALRDQIDRGVQGIDTREAGEVVDMIKDLTEAEEKCWKACYYKCIVESMHEEKEMMRKMPPEQRMGYDSWRYNSGRFAPTGRGHYDPAGYTPMEDGQIPAWSEKMHDMDPWMSSSVGYGDGANRDGQNRSSSGTSDRYGYTPSMRGMRYDNYAKARRGYDERKDAQSKTHMDTTAKEYVVDMAESIREMWKDADPALRKEIKNHFVALTGEMN